MGDTDTRELGNGGLTDLVAVLRADGREVIAPVARDGVLALDRIDSAAELPVGWQDTQRPGHARIVQTRDRRSFAFAAPSQPWKRFLHVDRSLVIRSHGASVIVAGDDQKPPPPLAFLGVQACDLAALDRLDTVLDRDETYRQRREDLVIVAVSCTRAADVCFCASVGTGPRPGSGADIVLVELTDGTVLATPHTATGSGLIERCTTTRAAHSDEVRQADALIDACAAGQQRRLDPAAPQRAAEHLDDLAWDAVAQRCLTCGNCTMVCPTCFCTTTEDRTDLSTGEYQRWRRSDSCFSLDFSHVHGGPVRSSAASRYRQWYLHKLVTWHDQFGSSGCVGCGRCITWCPTGIDITAVFSP